MDWLRQSTAVTKKFGPFLDDTDGVTEETGLTISQADIRLSKNGGNIAQSNNATGATHDELGYYGVPLDTTDTGTLGSLKVMIHESGALPVWKEFMVVPADVYDSLVLGTDVLQMGLANDAITPVVYNNAAVYIPYDGGIWIDSGAANVNTVVGVDGLPSNPVSTFAAARTLADAIGMQKYYITNHSNLTLAATHQDWVFEGIGLRNRINMGGQDVNDSFFYHIILSGTQGGSQKIEAKCSYLNGITDLNIIATNVWLTGNNTLKATTLSIIDHWSSNVPGQSTPELTFQAGVTSIGLRHGSGGIKVNNMTSDHTMSLETDGQLIVDATCNSGNISARGSMDITDNGTTMNITKTAVWNTSQSVQSVTNDVGITQAGADKVNGPSGAVIPDIDIGAPPNTPTPQQYRSTVWASLVNKAISDTSGAGEWKIFNASGTLAAKGTITDGSSIFTRSKLGAP